jgi:hypothetical protein
MEPTEQANVVIPSPSNTNTPSTAYERLKYYCEQNNRMELFHTRMNQQVEIIMRQTDYDDKTARDKLIEYDLNTMNIIRDYMRGYRDLDNSPYPHKKNNHSHSQSTQQSIYGEFRKFLDDASTKFYKQQEFNERAKQLYDKTQLSTQQQPQTNPSIE